MEQNDKKALALLGVLVALLVLVLWVAYWLGGPCLSRTVCNPNLGLLI